MAAKRTPVNRALRQAVARLRQEIDPLIELHLFSERALREARPTNFAGHILATGVKVA